MARHTAPDDRSFQRSLARAVGRAALLLAVVGGVVFGLTQLRDARPEGEETVLTDASAAATPDAAAAPPAAEPTAAPGGATEDLLSELPEDPDRQTVPIGPPPTDGASPAPAASEAPVTPEVDPPEAVTVQVLDGTGDEDLFNAAVRDVRALGYDVQLIAVAGTGSPTTTIYSTEGNEAEAEALRTADPRFTEVAPNERFETPVDLHLLIGEDWTED